MAEKSELTKAERETIIIFDEEGETAQIRTYNTRLKNKLTELANACPEQIIAVSVPEKGEARYIVPKTCVTVRAPYSEERRKADSSRARAARRRPPGDRME